MRFAERLAGGSASLGMSCENVAAAIGSYHLFGGRGGGRSLFLSSFTSHFFLVIFFFFFLPNHKEFFHIPSFIYGKQLKRFSDPDCACSGVTPKDALSLQTFEKVNLQGQRERH